MWNWSLRNYSDAYILSKGTISLAKTSAADFDPNSSNIKVIFKKSVTDITNAQVDNALGISVVILRYHLL